MPARSQPLMASSGGNEKPNSGEASQICHDLPIIMTIANAFRPTLR